MLVPDLIAELFLLGGLSLTTILDLSLKCTLDVFLPLLSDSSSLILLTSVVLLDCSGLLKIRSIIDLRLVKSSCSLVRSSEMFLIRLDAFFFLCLSTLSINAARVLDRPRLLISKVLVGLPL